MEPKEPRTGSFCWIDLSTSDLKGATEFYTKLFGWTTNAIPMGEGEPYVMVQKDGRDVGALAAQPKQERDMGIPPHWSSYVAVESADEAAEKARSLGGMVVAGPFDVFDAGRMAVIIDPQGAMFCIWQAGRNKGIGVYAEPNSLCWNELTTSDIEAARTFYTQLFGWTPKVSSEYTEWHIGDRAVGGAMEMKDMPVFWMPYFAVADCDAAAAQVTSLGGKIHVGPKDIPNVGKFAIASDPQSAVFAVIKLTMGGQ